MINGGLDQLVGNGRDGRKPQIAFLVLRAGGLAQGAGPILQSLLDLGNGEPLGIFELRIVCETDGLVGGVADLGDGSDHQVSWIWPWLRRVDHDARQGHAGFFPHLAADCIFDRFARLDEAGQGRIPIRWEPLGPAEQQALAVGGQGGHNDSRIGAGERQVRDGRAR